MLVSSLMTLGIAALATFVSLKSQEEVVKVAMALAALISTILSLFFAPWIIKLLIITVPILLEKLNYWSKEL